MLPTVSRSPVCEGCWSEIPQQRENCCALAVARISSGQPPTPLPIDCRACRMAPPAFLRAVSFGVYEGSMRAAIHALKYDRIAPI
jgi:predicted amidophosphoribosyltransferase